MAVTNVVDGDTIDVSDGTRVRLIGIDTPERGECGYAEATSALGSLVSGKEVFLVAGARDNVDRYDRLLRYVEVSGVDANLEMISSGHAIARYDSRDGYSRHAREDGYVAADATSSSTDACEAPSPSPTSPLVPPPAADPDPPGGGGGLDPQFGTCKEASAAGFGPYTSGSDPKYDWYRDQDKDGVVCE